ncbi:unnamed protein product [Hyaloperonospora brassicae]|uniref:Biogenesis of lysosome-related organelles complex 1 subunit 1 n=1 Tax=Hyaloperonospora brassicae TaxID=162125 RepID=A0AAV0SZ99_HYABA|nr:unnamed protein product [Hyaloperonospora brassicae]
MSSVRTHEVKAAIARLDQHRDDRVHAQMQLTESLDALKAAQSRMLVKRLDGAVHEQRNVEREALVYAKNVNALCQRAARWKAEQKRFRASLDDLNHFADWAAAAESDLHAIAGNLEYVCAVLEKEQEGAAKEACARAQQSM